jgi:O-antigen/teichoic acid export membrane protein
MSITKTFSNLFSDKTLTKKASLNAFASVLDYGTRWLVTFTINPLLVTGLGDFGYGAWQVLSRLIGYISPAGGRPTQALKWTIASQQASTDYEEKRRQVGSAISVWIVFLPLLLFLGALLAWYVPIWLEAPLELYSGLRWATVVLVGNLIFTNLAEIPQSVLRGENLGYKRMGLTTLFILLGGGLVALALFLDTGIVGVATANLVVTACTGVLFFNIVRSTVAWFGIAKPVFDGIRKFLGLSGWFLAWNLVLQLFKAGDVIILGIFDSAELVSRYSLTRYIPETIIGVIAIIVFGITPGLGGILGSGDLKKAAQVRSEIMTITWFIVTVFGSTMLLWNRSFVELWVGGEYYAGSISNLLIILMVSQFVFIRNDANIIDLTLDLRKKVWMGIVSAGLSAGLSVVLVGTLKMGIVGLTMGFICGQLIVSIGYPLLVGCFLQVSPSSQLKGAIRPAIMTGLSFASVSILGNSIAVNSWLSLILQAGVTTLLLSLIIFYVGMPREQRNNLLRRARKVLLTERNKS